MLHGFGDELELAAGFVDGERAGDADGVRHPWDGNGGELRLAAEEDDGELCFRVLESEIAVAAGRGTPVGDFAFDGDVAVGALDEVADVADELAHGKDVVLRGRRGFGLGDGRRRLGSQGSGLFGEDVGGG